MKKKNGMLHRKPLKQEEEESFGPKYSIFKYFNSCIKNIIKVGGDASQQS